MVVVYKSGWAGLEGSVTTHIQRHYVPGITLRVKKKKKLKSTMYEVPLVAETVKNPT